uniref:Retrovirus-related Pol polyprotein from transposon TNT 1-94 n=1 Tax=Tanacetum cinerariifolium TaxID=118510 RepID=A0A6L2JW87_TANCI|nr:retrovirus-related Pol polyprotein from transposon TNT 1-94 [Tanacetum cinerariifolium]
MVLAIAALRKLKVHQMDVNPTFLNGDLEKEIYMNQPEGFIAPGLESKVCRLVRSLYGLRKAAKQGHQISPYHCGNILMNGTCLKCNSEDGNSFTYDHTLESFNKVQSISNPPLQSHFNIYLCQICESNSHYGYECSQRVPLVYEPEPCYNQSCGDNDYPHDLPGYSVNPSLNIQNEPSDHELFISKLIQQKLQNEYTRPFPAIAITFDLPTVEPEDSLRMGDEHLDTIFEKESDEFIKSSVENLVPKPNESEDLSDKFISENSDAAIESFSPFPIPVEDSDSLMEEIDLSFTPNDSLSPSIEEDDYEFERDILILEELLSNNSLSLPENESYHFDISSSSHPPAKPPDNDSGILTVKVVGDISEQNVPMPRLFPTQPTFVSNQEKSPHPLSYRGFKTSQLYSESLMTIYGGNTPILDVSFLYFTLLDQLKYGGIGSS